MRAGSNQYRFTAPELLDLAMQANAEYLRSFNISSEIAKHLHREGRSLAQEDLHSIMVYNLDRERLETELRQYLIIRLIDGSNTKPNEPFDAGSEEKL